MQNSMKPVNWCKKMQEGKQKFTQACISYAKNERKHREVSSDFKKQFSKNFKGGTRKEGK